MLPVKPLCVLILTILELNSVLPVNSIGCDSSEDLQDESNTDPLDLLYDGVIKTYSDVQIVSILSTTNNKFEKVYIDARLENDDDGRTDLVIFTTENFEKYIKEQTETVIFLYVNFECSGGTRRTLLFYQPIKEGNYFPPEFSKEEYEFLIPTPLYKGFDLTMFEEIRATDDDLSGYEINFSSTDSEAFNILVGTLPRRDLKMSFASLELMSILLSLKEKIEFSIIATDTGNPPRSSSPVKVVITADSSNSLPPIPRFMKTVFYGSLTEDFQLPDLEIELDIATYSTDVSFRKLSDDDNIFQITNIENVVFVTLTNALDVDSIKRSEPLTFEIEALNSRLTETGRTAVSISFPQKTESYFKKEIYEGKLYLKSGALELGDMEVAVDERQIEHLQFSLQGSNSDLFEIEQKQNVVNLLLKPGLNTELWKNIKFLTLRLGAEVNSEEIASTNIILDLIHSIVSFEKPAYIGSINSGGDLVLDPIVLLTDTNTTDDIEIELLRTDAKLFSFTKQGNQIVLELDDTASEIDFQNRNYLSLEVAANELGTGVKATCLVLIMKPKAENEKYLFEKNIYEAEINDEAKLIAENVVFDKELYNKDIQFSLLGRDAEYFGFQQNENEISLYLKDNFNISEHYNTNALWIELRALSLKEKLEASTLVVVHIARETVPEFEQANYIGELTQENVFNLRKIVLKMPTWKTYTSIDLQGEYSDFFKLTVSENQIEISLKSELSEEVKERDSIVLLLIASNNAMKGYSTIVINLPKSRNLTNIFKKTIQNGRISEGGHVQELKIDDIEFVKEYNVADFTCTLSGDESKRLDYTVIAPKNVIKLILAAELPNDIIQQRFYITFLLECQNKEDGAISGSTIIFLDLPGSNGQNGCPTPEPPTFIPEFENVFYNFFAKPTYVGSLQSVHAIIRESDAGVRYSLVVENEHLRPRINIDSTSGDISLSALISPGRYYFKIIAENEVTHSQSQAQGRLDIDALIQCEDHVSVSNSLLIKYLDEESEHNDIMNVELGNCEFYVFSMEPDNQEYVKIDPSTKMLTMIPTDREDEVFSNMILPQIEVKLKLDCSSEKKSEFEFLKRVERDLRDSKAFAENRSLVLTEDILFAKDVTILSIMVVDVNDNRPEFVLPKQERLVVGFPDEEISTQIFPENVIKVLALDKDNGLNAKIRYSIQPNEHFQIDPNNGDVYPYKNAMKGLSDIELVVYATDKDGADDGLSSKFTMIVRVLAAKHFTLLTFLNENVNNIEALMEDARSRTGIDFVIVKYATVSTTDNVPMPRAGTVQFVQKVWAYAFNGDAAITSNDIKRKLSEGGSDMNILAQTFEEVLDAPEVVEFDRAQNVTGYIAGLCVLAVIIVACIGFILWRNLYQRFPRTHDEPGNNLSSRSPTNQNFNLKQGAEIDIQKQTELLSDTLYEPSFYSKRESVKILGTTTQESTDDGRRRQIEKLNSNLNGSVPESYDGNESVSSNESMRPRATVTFNELVERIHIDSDDEEKNKIR